MRLAKLVTTSVLIWTTPILGRPQPQSDAERQSNQEDGLAHARNLLIFAGGSTVAAGVGVAVGSILANRKSQFEGLRSSIEGLEDHIRDLKRLAQSQHESLNAGNDITRQHTSAEVSRLEAKISRLENQLKEWQFMQHELHFVQQYRLYYGKFMEQVLKDVQKKDPDFQLCLSKELELGPPGERKELTGMKWNLAVLKCGPDPNLFIHPRESIWFGLAPVSGTSAEGANNQAQAQSQKDEDEGGDTKLYFAPANLFQDRLNGLSRAIGGAIQTVKNAGKGMPAGIPSVGRLRPGFAGL